MTWDTLPQILRLLLAMAFVIGLMGGLAFLLKKLGLGATTVNRGGPKRLKLIETLPLDGRRRAAILQRDDVQHLVILGANGETVIETDIQPIEKQTNDNA